MKNAEYLAATLGSLNDVFDNPDRLIRHLSVMKYNTRLEWFNLALVAENAPAAENGFRLVLSAQDWINNGISFPLKGEGIPLLFPHVQGNKLTWVIKNLYTVGDFGFEEPANENSIPTILNTYDSNEAIQTLCLEKGNSWQKPLLQSYLKSIDVAREKKNKFLLAALELTWGSNLRMKSGVRKSDLGDMAGVQNPLEIYRLLASTVTGFPRYFLVWMNHQKTEVTTSSDLASLTLDKIRGVRR